MLNDENVKIYERVKNENKLNFEDKPEKSKLLLKGFLFLTFTISISRVIMINKSSPFGIAFLIAILMLGDNRLSIVTGLGTELGYLTNMMALSNSLMYITIIPTLVFISIILNNYVRRDIKKYLLFGVVIIMTLFYNILIQKYSLLISLGNTTLESIAIIPIYIVLEFGVKSFKKLKTKHLFGNEEIIAISIILALIVAGTWGLSLFKINLLNILSICSIIVIGYTCGTSIAATSGVAMGIIVGMSTNNIFAYATMLGLIGLVSGIFKEGGKLICSASSFIVFCILKLYITTYNVLDPSQFIFIEGVIAALIFIIIPDNIYDTLSCELDMDKKNKKYEEGYINKVKGIFTDRLDKFSEVLVNMASTLNNLADNDKLDLTTKSSGLVENLANRVCNSCDTCRICWGRELVNTYSAFQELIEGAQNGSYKFPPSLEKKCMKKGALIRNTEDIVNKFIINEMWRNRLAEGRELIANQFNNMAKSVNEILYEYSADFNEDRELEKKILAILEKYDIEVQDVFALRDKYSRLNLQISFNSCNGGNLCGKKILPLVNECVEDKMRIKHDGCRINPNSKVCTAYFEEVPRFEVITSVARQMKDGQTIYGDSFSFGEIGYGDYMMAISDGMGSGPQAGRESKAVVDLIEKFTEAGFSLITAINTVNSIMSLKFSEEEKFSTVDLSAVDLYSGDIDFIKVGAVASFIKRGNTIDIIKSKTLPIGILDEADIEIHKKRVRSGDLIVMLTDGIIDCNEELGGRVDWILDYLCRNDNGNVKELAEGLLREAKNMSNNKVKDDMTVMISKINSL